MKTTLAILAFVLSALTTAVSQAKLVHRCEDIIKNARIDLARTQDRFNVGEVTRTDVATAEFQLLNLSLQCREIAKEQYCNEAPKVAQTILYGTIEEARLGHRSEADVSAARQTLRTVTVRCQ